MFKWELDRPLAIFDIEATGTNVRADRIVELAIARIHPDQSRDSHVFRVNPRIPIPSEASDIHGIYDRDVAECPTFSDICDKVASILHNCDLAGFNVIRFDIPMLEEEFIRSGKDFHSDSFRVVDAQRIYHKREPRDLTAALAFYAGEVHVDAHGAKADVDATISVLEGQLEKYSDLPRNVEELAEYCDMRDPSWVDKTGRLRWVNGQVTLNFGKKKGTLLAQVIKNEPSFIKWMLRSDFPRDTQEIVARAAEGEMPQPPQTH